MELQPPPPHEPFQTLEAGLKYINDYALAQGYAVVTARTKNSKKGDKRKAWIRCDRGGKTPGPTGFGRRQHTTSRLIECPFLLILKLELGFGWALTLKNTTHNHAGTLAGSHPVHRKAALTQEVLDIIHNQTRTQTTPGQILSHLRLDIDEELPLFIRQDIYNAKAHLRRQALGPLKPTQALMQYLNGEDWFMAYEVNEEGLLTHLFFCRASFKKILKHNYEVLLIDATYKTNQYKIPLVIITGCTALNTTFYVGFAFVRGEKTPDYTWVLTQIKALYGELGISWPNIILTDAEKALIASIPVVFPNTAHLLCI